jgi:hypothetical protein
MITVDAQLDPAELQKLLSAVDAVDWQVHFQEIDSPRFMALKYIEQLRMAITGQRFMSGYAPYHPRYKDWKNSYGKRSGFWQLFGDLLMNLNHWRNGTSSYFAGIRQGVMDTGGKSWTGKGDRGKPKPIAMYGWVMEEGLSGKNKAGKHPARPIFRPTLFEFAFGDSPIHGERILRDIGSKWK